MKLFTMTRLNRRRLIPALAIGALMAGVAAAQQFCPVPPEPIPEKQDVHSLKGAPVPLPAALDTVVKDRPKAIALGKALFWDKQAGSDGQACASCHFHAGADNRTKNALTPGLRAVPPDTTFQATKSGGGGVNYQLKQSDFPFHVLTDPLDRNSDIVFTTNDAASSQGTYGGTFNLLFGLNNEKCDLENPAIFHVGGKLARKVEPRNTPTVINAIFQFRTFWDGRANNHFNGVNPFGRRDVNARVLQKQADGSVIPVALDLENAALASQAVGPATNEIEMSCKNRTFKLIGRKLTSVIPRPLHGQKVSPTDSVLGPYADPLHGLKAPNTYETMIQGAFHDKYWNAPGYASPDGFTMMEENFSMFWGLAIMLYESTLVSDDSPFDRFMGVTQNGVVVTQPDFSALTNQQINGLSVFMGKGKCVNCHKGPDFTGAGVRLQAEFQEGGIVERMPMAANGVALYDNGFYNIGVTPTNHDLGVGATDPFGKPLSFTRQFKQMIAGQNVPDPFQINPCTFESDPCQPVTDPNHRDAVDGAFKTPTLRNVELTGPYMHNGGMKTLEEVVEFYNRGGNRRGPDGNDTTGFGSNPSNLDPDITRLNLTAEEQVDLVAFMKSLTDDRVRCEKAPFDHPALANSNGQSMLDNNKDGKLDDIIIRLSEVGAAGRPATACLKPFHQTLP